MDQNFSDAFLVGILSRLKYINLVKLLISYFKVGSQRSTTLLTTLPEENRFRYTIPAF